jgi:hypothetical protein
MRNVTLHIILYNLTFSALLAGAAACSTAPDELVASTGSSGMGGAATAAPAGLASNFFSAAGA